MSFVKFATSSVINNSTNVDNIFLNEFLPHAPAECVRVYLYGLYKANNAESFDNTLESFAKVLNLSEQDIESAFLYWQEQGVVQILNTTPFEVRYLPVKEALHKVKKFNKQKYASFNLQVQELIEGRMLTPSEFNEYYTLIEAFHMNPEALIMVIKYATDLKGKDVGYKYISTIAKNWAYAGIRTAEQVEEKLLEHEQNNEQMREVFKTLGLKRNANFEERQMYVKWTKEFGFTHLDLLEIAKTLKKRGGMLKLDSKLENYYANKLLSMQEIEEYEQQKDFMFDLARTVTKTLGLYYQDLTVVIETYITDWLNKGFSEETLTTIATYCFKHNTRTLEGMNLTVNKFYKLGLVSLESLSQYMGNLIKTDQTIKQVLENAGLSRNVTSWDRDFYRTWTYSWNLSKELIMYSAELANGKNNPMKYMNSILSSWHQNKITTLEEAKKQNVSATPASQKPQVQKFQTHSYTSEQLNALFDNLDEVDI